MTHHEGTKVTKGTKEHALGVSQSVLGAAMEARSDPARASTYLSSLATPSVTLLNFNTVCSATACVAS